MSIINYIHYPLNLFARSVVQVELKQEANILLLDRTNFWQYKSGKVFIYYGGWTDQSLLAFAAPRAGRWHLVIDTGGYSGISGKDVKVVIK